VKPQVCQEAALGPIRELDAAALRSVRPEDVRPLSEQVRACAQTPSLVPCMYLPYPFPGPLLSNVHTLRADRHFVRLFL
jgi:hypothetical protein